jgi:hypothetical protein
MNRITVALLIALVALAEGCASTLQAKPVHQSNFFKDHAKLGIAAEAVVPHVHAPAKINWSAYDKIQLNPVIILDDWSSQRNREQQEDLQQLANVFYDMLSQKLSQDYILVERPAPGSMLIQVAITHAERSWIAPQFLSKVSWQLQVLNRVWTYFSGKPAFAGEMTVEFTVHDAQTGAFLFAGTDRRVGGQNLFDKEVFNSWGDAQHSLEYWTEQSVYQLCLARRGANCIRPKA